MRESPVLVVGATGRTGRLIVARLLEHGSCVRALMREPAKAEAALPSGAQRFLADVRHTGTLAEPMAGAGALIIASCGGAEPDNSAQIVDYHGTRNLIEQATAAGVELILFISTIHASRPEHYMDVEPMSLGWKARAEEVIRGSSIPYCIVRPGWLTDGAGGQPLALSQGDTAEGRISRADLADLCTQLLRLPAARGKTFEVIAVSPERGSPLVTALAALTPDRARPARHGGGGATTRPDASGRGGWRTRERADRHAR